MVVVGIQQAMVDIIQVGVVLIIVVDIMLILGHRILMEDIGNIKASDTFY